MTLELRSLPIDRDAAVAALESLSPILDRLPDYPPPQEIAEGLPETTEALAEAAVDEYDDGNGAIHFVEALLLARVLGDQLEASVHEGMLLVESDDMEAVIHHGSLTVKGSVDLHNNLIVLGDLTVEGRVRDVVEWSRLIVAGNLSSTTICSGGPIWAGGDVDAKVVVLSYHGGIFTGEGLRAELVVGSPEGVGIDGALSVTHHVGVEQWRDNRAGALV